MLLSSKNQSLNGTKWRLGFRDPMPLRTYIPLSHGVWPPLPLIQINLTGTNQVYVIFWLPATSFIIYLETKQYIPELWSKRREINIPSTNFHSYRIQISSFFFICISLFIFLRTGLYNISGILDCDVICFPI